MHEGLLTIQIVQHYHINYGGKIFFTIEEIHNKSRLTEPLHNTLKGYLTPMQARNKKSKQKERSETADESQ